MKFAYFGDKINLLPIFGENACFNKGKFWAVISCLEGSKLEWGYCKPEILLRLKMNIAYCKCSKSCICNFERMMMDYPYCPE